MLNEVDNTQTLMVITPTQLVDDAAGRFRRLRSRAAPPGARGGSQTGETAYLTVSGGSPTGLGSK